MYYIIYKTTNLVNGKYYIGKHQLPYLDDGYLGSGKILKQAISKYGLENFHREILHICETESKMNALEKILVVPDKELNYNLCPGGHGGFGYINVRNIWRTQKHLDAALKNQVRATEKLQHLAKNDLDWKKKQGAKIREVHASNKDGYVNPFEGKRHTEDSKNKMRKSKNNGKSNSQFGTMWITNGSKNLKIKKIDNIPEGWYKGRTIHCSFV